MKNNLLLEMADFFINFDIEKKANKDKGGQNKLTQNGGTDRVKPPHFHLYFVGKSTSYYSLEVDLQRLLCFDEIFFSRVIIDGREEVPGLKGQMKYSKYAERIYDIMQMKPNVKKPDYLKGCVNNVEAAIRIFNKDADLVQTAGYNVPDDEKLLKIMQEKSNTMKILEKYNSCFAHIPKEIRQKYKDCFAKPF